ncbi:hypothetical protein D3C84_1013520 [compost metagenome]
MLHRFGGDKAFVGGLLQPAAIIFGQGTEQHIAYRGHVQTGLTPVPFAVRQ